MNANDVSKPQDGKRQSFRGLTINTMLPTIFMIGLVVLLATVQWAHAGTTP
jgi:hypothetical protein